MLHIDIYLSISVSMCVDVGQSGRRCLDQNFCIQDSTLAAWFRFQDVQALVLGKPETLNREGF